MIPDIGLSTQAATLVSGLLGGMIGSVGTYYGQSRLRDKQKSEKSDWIRRALLSELESMDALDAWPLEPPGGTVPFGDWLHNQVFEAVSSELGMLSSDELHALITFHGKAKHVQSDIQSLWQSPEDWPEGKIDPIQSHLADVKRNKQAAIRLLSEKIEDDY